jgi:alpha-glucuronidase
MRKGLIAAGLIAALLGCAFGGVVLWIAFQENSQGEYFDTVTGQVDIAYSAELFLAASFPFALIVFAALALGLWILPQVKTRDRT